MNNITTNQITNNGAYSPTLLDAIKVTWSFVWRTFVYAVLLMLLMIPFAVLFGVISAISLKNGQSLMEGNQIIEKSFIFIVGTMIGFYALRRICKLTYETFTFGDSLISDKTLLLISLIMQGWNFLSSYILAGEVRILYLLASLVINLFVTALIFLLLMSGGLFGVKLPVTAREDRGC